jgi:DNA-binding NarL/FixJ family response regulator
MPDTPIAFGKSDLFARALVVEDLLEPRQWLTELLPQALPMVLAVDAVATLAQAREMMRHHRYGLALVDWGLPDGTGESLISELVAARPGAVVIVATIHDDDMHVFPALRAGASGYILKSQPRAVVMAQLQGIERDEPALSPSIALRVLRHFRAIQQAANPEGTLPDDPVSEPQRLEFHTMPEIKLTDREVDVLRLIAKGYKSPEVARLLSLSSHTVSGYVRDIYRKLGITSRAEAALEATRRGLVGMG